MFIHAKVANGFMFSEGAIQNHFSGMVNIMSTPIISY